MTGNLDDDQGTSLFPRRFFSQLAASAFAGLKCTRWGLAEMVMNSAQDPDRGSGDDSSQTAARGEQESPRPGALTLGGMQFWGDSCFFRGYKIQQNVLSGHYRLLGGDNRRWQSGTLRECEQQLQRIREAQQLTPDTGHAVVYLHGIGRSSRSLATLRNSLPDQGYTHVLFEYPSTRIPLRQSAEYLQRVIESLTAVDRISFVTHSMGGLVVRRWLQDHRDPRAYRMVMMGTPNNGAQLADMLKSSILFRTVYGPAGQELGTESNGAIHSLPIPDFEFGIVAGGRGDEKGFNPLLPGDNDGTVTVASARLAGARDFLLVRKIHSFLMTDATVMAAVRCFLEHGRFSLDRPPEPIPEPAQESVSG